VGTTSNAFKVVDERPSRFLQRVGSLLRRLGESFDTSTYSVISSTKFSHPADGDKDVLPKGRDTFVTVQGTDSKPRDQMIWTSVLVTRQRVSAVTALKGIRSVY
jgi:hypothetical protein